MSRHPKTDLNTRILFDMAGGRSRAITLPMETLRAFEWNTGQKLTLTVDEKKKRITIEAKKPSQVRQNHKTIAPYGAWA